jgi:hypothetical protein
LFLFVGSASLIVDFEFANGFVVSMYVSQNVKCVDKFFMNLRDSKSDQVCCNSVVVPKKIKESVYNCILLTYFVLLHWETDSKKTFFM